MAMFYIDFVVQTCWFAVVANVSARLAAVIGCLIYVAAVGMRSPHIVTRLLIITMHLHDTLVISVNASIWKWKL